MTEHPGSRLRAALVGVIVAVALAGLAAVAWLSTTAIEAVRAEPVPTLQR